MTNTPDFILRKFQNRYSIELFIGMEESYYGFGYTIKEALDEVYKKSKLRISEIESILDYLNEANKINVAWTENKINQYNEARKKLENKNSEEKLLINKISEFFNIDSVIIVSPIRTQSDNKKIIYYALSMYGLTPSKIGRLLNKNHHTIITQLTTVKSKQKEKAKELLNFIKKDLDKVYR